jgi:hypothetical protein
MYMYIDMDMEMELEIDMNMDKNTKTTNFVITSSSIPIVKYCTSTGNQSIILANWHATRFLAEVI